MVQILSLKQLKVTQNLNCNRRINQFKGNFSSLLVQCLMYSGQSSYNETSNTQVKQVKVKMSKFGT
jgi:hypothetical protein